MEITLRRTRENYEYHVQLNDDTGVKLNSRLNSLKYFHVTENVGVDIMLPHFIYEEKRFSLEQLNERIAGFELWLWK